MIPLPSGTKIWLVAGITDMRNGFNGLAAKVQTALKDDPMSGHVFIFRGRSGSQVKLLWAVPADQTAGARALRLAVSPRWQSVPDTGAAGNVVGSHRLATAEADLPDHAVGLFILVVAE
jgi:transposase